jgi:hypothetical protein
MLLLKAGAQSPSDHALRVATFYRTVNVIPDAYDEVFTSCSMSNGINGDFIFIAMAKSSKIVQEGQPISIVGCTSAQGANSKPTQQRGSAHYTVAI